MEGHQVALGIWLGELLCSGVQEAKEGPEWLYKLPATPVTMCGQEPGGPLEGSQDTEGVQRSDVQRSAGLLMQ
jgi:hypothetical protein